MITGSDLFDALPVAAYSTDADGRIIACNEAAVQLWGGSPRDGAVPGWRLCWPDGRPMAAGETPVDRALKEGRIVQGQEVLAERADGTRRLLSCHARPLDGGSGAIALLVAMSERQEAEIALARLAAIVSSSEDAIVSKTLDGKITSWNAAAARIFGYAPEEMIGQPITRIIPPELLGEEHDIIARLRRGERVDHFDTVRVAKDGRRVDISLTISPLRDAAGRIVGASKIARDITERKRSEELQRLLFDELNHRVKNTLAMIQAIASQSMRHARNPADFVVAFNGRVQALARAHDLLVQGKMQGADVAELVREQVVLGGRDGDRITCTGPLLLLDPRAAVQLALVLHELATNARKHGALSVPAGRLSIAWMLRQHTGRALHLTWTETGGPKVSVPKARGFGTTLIERLLEPNGGDADLRYGADGVTCTIRLPLPDAVAPAVPGPVPTAVPSGEADAAVADQPPDLRGRRILLIEDEPLVALDIETQLGIAGIDVVGPASTVEKAQALIAGADFDAALVDANLGGRRVDELAAALTRKGVPFAFATGYGREALPLAFRDAPLIVKPFEPNRILATVRDLLNPPPGVVPIRLKE